VGKEGDAVAARRCRREAGVPFDELIDEPAAEVDPGGNLDEEDEHQRPDPCVRVQDDESAEDGGDRAAGAEGRDACVRSRAEEQRDLYPLRSR
jgi:hypothetical protein